MQADEELFAVPRRPLLKSVERSFIATYGHFLSLSIEDSEVISSSWQKDKRLYKLLRTADLHRDRELIPRRENALNAPSDVMSTAVTTPVKVQDCRSHKASATNPKPFFATQVRDLPGRDDRRAIHDLPESRSHGRAEAVHYCALTTTRRYSVFENWEVKKAKRAEHIRIIDQRLEHSLEWTLSTLMVWARHSRGGDSETSTI